MSISSFNLALSLHLVNSLADGLTSLCSSPSSPVVYSHVSTWKTKLKLIPLPLTSGTAPVKNKTKPQSPACLSAAAQIELENEHSWHLLSITGNLPRCTTANSDETDAFAPAQTLPCGWCRNSVARTQFSLNESFLSTGHSYLLLVRWWQHRNFVAY